MASATLNATVRFDHGKGAARQIRRAGSIPCVIYGHAREPQSLTVNGRETERLLQRISAASTIIELSIDGSKPARTLIREVQRHPFKRNILHIDFQEVVAGETVTVQCPLVYVGVPEGVRNDGGILDQILHELHIEVDPANIPSRIELDISGLQVGRSMHVSDIPLPPGVTALEDPGTTVCVCSAPRVSATTDETADASAEPELIRKAKADDEI